MWSMDFVVDNLFDGNKLRMFTVLDCYTWESLTIHLGQSHIGQNAVQMLKAIVSSRGKHATIKTDNGWEFVGKVMGRSGL